MTTEHPTPTPDDGERLAAAIRRIEESRATHVEWAAHLRECDHCQTYPPEYVQTADEQDQIVAEYDNVLDLLRTASPARTAAPAVGVRRGPARTAGLLGTGDRRAIEREQAMIALRGIRGSA